jgi:hypothetical protein
MMKCIFLGVVFIIILALLVSCSNVGEDVIAFDAKISKAPMMKDKEFGQMGNQLCLGFWQIVIDSVTGRADVIRLRTACLMLNALYFIGLEKKILKLENLYIDFENSTVDVDVLLTHPFGLNPEFPAFDVRGVVFGAELTNADGHTIVMNAGDFNGIPFGYEHGNLHGGDESLPGGGAWPKKTSFKYYCDNLGPDEKLSDFFSDPINLVNRGKFSGKEPHRRHFQLKWEKGVKPDFLRFNYAIYINYDSPVGVPPITLDSFPITTANSAEAFCLSVTETVNTLYYHDPPGIGGGSISLDVEIWDWQCNINDVIINSLDLCTIPLTSYDIDTGSGSTKYSNVYQFVDVNGFPTTSGDLDILITVYDSNTFGQSWFMGLLPPTHGLYNEPVFAGWLHTTTVKAE